MGVFTVDGYPLLLGEGDLLVIGTQRHAVPKMPEVKEGRVSVSIFWYPENKRDFWPALDGTGCAQCGRPTELLQEAEDGTKYCEECWLGWQEENGMSARNGEDTGSHDAGPADIEVTEDDLLAAVLEMSRADY